MKLLFDQNLSRKLPGFVADLFPGSTQTGLLGLERASDREVWEAARAGGFAIVTLDADFADLAALRGPPPKVLRLRCGNAPTRIVADLLRRHAEAVAAFAADHEAACLELL